MTPPRVIPVISMIFDSVRLSWAWCIIYRIFIIPICLMRDWADSPSIGFSRISRTAKTDKAWLCHRSLKLLAIGLTIYYLHSLWIEASRFSIAADTEETGV